MNRSSRSSLLVVILPLALAALVACGKSSRTGNSVEKTAILSKEKADKESRQENPVCKPTYLLEKIDRATQGSPDAVIKSLKGSFVLDRVYVHYSATDPQTGYTKAFSVEMSRHLVEKAYETSFRFECADGMAEESLSGVVIQLPSEIQAPSGRVILMGELELATLGGNSKAQKYKDASSPKGFSLKSMGTEAIASLSSTGSIELRFEIENAPGVEGERKGLKTLTSVLAIYQPARFLR